MCGHTRNSLCMMGSPSDMHFKSRESVLLLLASYTTLPKTFLRLDSGLLDAVLCGFLPERWKGHTAPLSFILRVWDRFGGWSRSENIGGTRSGRRFRRKRPLAMLPFLPAQLSLTPLLPPAQEGEDIPRDWTTMFDTNLFRFDTSLIPEAIALYDKLAVKKNPLSLIPPSFETPLPPLQAATFPPAIREPAPPALELFDLDENFASEAVSVSTEHGV